MGCVECGQPQSRYLPQSMRVWIQFGVYISYLTIHPLDMARGRNNKGKNNANKITASTEDTTDQTE